MNDLINFTYEGREVRTFIKDGEPQWVIKDVAEVLEYPETTISNTAKMVQHVPDEWKGRYPIPTPGGEQEMLCLSEQGLYFFLGRSDKPAALPFQKWIAGEVVPSIRKTGSYALPGRENIRPEFLLEAFKAGGISRTQFQAMIGAPPLEADPQYYRPGSRKKQDKAERDEEIRQETAVFVEKYLEFTENWYDIVKENEMYALFKNDCIEKKPITRNDFHNQFARDYPPAKFGRNKQDVAIWHNVRLKAAQSG
jgi:prophage antirepressor-like protein